MILLWVMQLVKLFQRRRLLEILLELRQFIKISDYARTDMVINGQSPFRVNLLLVVELVKLFQRRKHLEIFFVCVEVLRPSHPNGLFGARSVYLTTL